MKRRILAMLFVGVCILFVGCGESEMRIELEENPTTGYQWAYTMEPDGIIKETKNEYQSPTSPLLGATGKHIWAFAPVADGKVTLTFTYRREWEPKEDDTVVRYTCQVSNGRISQQQEIASSSGAV